MERGAGLRRTGWDHRGLAFGLVDLAVTDPDTGEIVGDPDTAVRVADLLLGAADIDRWRVKVLREHGIDPDEYSRQEKARRTVTAPRGGE